MIPHAGRTLVKGLLWTLFGAAALVISVLVHLDSAPGRRLVCGQAETQASTLLKGKLRIGACSAVRVDKLRLEHMSLEAPDGRRVARIEAVEVHPELLALLRGVVHVRELRIEEPVISVAEHEGELALQTALTPVQPPPEEEEETEGATSIRVDALRVRRGTIADVPCRMEVRGLHANLDVTLNDDIAAAVQHLDANVVRHGTRIARLRDTTATLRTTPGARSTWRTHLDAGRDRVAIHGTMRWGHDAPAYVDARLTASISSALLERLGKSDAATRLRGTVDLDVHAEGAPDDVRVRAGARTAGGPVSVYAHYTPARIEVTAKVPHLRVSQVWAGAGGPLEGRLEVSVTTPPVDAPDAPYRLEAEAEGIRYAAWALPQLSLVTFVSDEHARIASVDLPHLTRDRGRFDLTARIDFDEGAQVSLHARLPDLGRDPNIRRLAPGAHGKFRADVHVEVRPAGHVSARGRLTLRKALLPGLRVSRLHVDGEVDGTLPTPAVDFHVRGRDLATAARAVERVALDIEGSAPRYEVRGRGKLRSGPRAKLRLDVRVAPPRYVVEGRITADEVWPSRLFVRISGVTFRPDGGIRARAVRVDGEGLELVARGAYRFGASSDLKVGLRTLELAAVGEMFRVEDELTGSVTGDLRFSGTPAHPELNASMRLTEASFAGIAAQATRVDASWSARERRARVDAEVELGRHGTARFDADVALAARPDPASALLAGRTDAQVTVDALDLSISEPMPDTPSVHGFVDGELEFHGSLRQPDLRLEADARRLSTPELAPTDADVRMRLQGRDASMDMHAARGGAHLLSVSFAAQVHADELVRGGDPLEFLQRPWRFEADVPERPLRALPLRDLPELPVTVAFDAQLAGGHEPIHGDVELAARWTGTIPGMKLCEDVRAPRVVARVRVRPNTTRISMDGHLGDRRILEADASAPVAWAQWARGASADLPPISATLDVSEARFAQMPYLCAQGDGTVGAHVEIADLATRDPRLDLVLEATNVRFGDRRPVDFVLAGEANAQRADLDSSMKVDGQHAMQLEVRAPLTWPNDGMQPSLGEGSAHAELRLDRAPVSALASVAPMVRRTGGTLDGAVRASGTGPDDFRIDGHIELNQVSFTVLDPFMRVSELNGRLTLARERIVLEDITVKERRGKVRVDGVVDLSQWQPTTVEMRVRADQYPIRNEGNVYATLDGKIRIDGRLDTRPAKLEIVLADLSVALPEQMGGDVQDLGQHPDVIYEGQPGFDRSLGVSEALAEHRGDEEEAAAKDAFPFVVDVRSRNPFWVRRSDFAVQMSLDMKVRKEGADTILQGPIEVQRGFLNMFGKSFDFEEGGTIRFTGAIPVNPVLDLAAIHRLPSRETVTVRIDGHLDQPELSFESSDPAARSEAEIIALLMGVRGRERQGEESAEGQARSVLTGLTSGLVGSLTRRELGQYVPVLSVESEGTAGSTQLRAGFQMDSLIPKAWRGIVRGMYLEGQIGGGGDDTDTATQAGFLLELLFPRDLSAEATYEQPDNWSLDLLWEP